jgi:hypothetical protein
LRKDICGSVPFVGRSPRASLAFLAALGLSGCLLFTDPINKAPTVTIDPHSDPLRAIPTEFTATVLDDRDSPASLLLEWAEFGLRNQGCLWITTADWVSTGQPAQDSSASYEFTAKSLDPVCLCARTTDHNGAAGLGCTKITPVNSAPVATIVDVSGLPSSQPRPLCSQVHLSAESSTFIPGDQFNWSIQYTGTDSAGKSVQLSPCTGVVDSKKDQHRCFYAAGPGGYAVTLQIIDSAVLNGATISTPSNLASFALSVSVDTPPCLQRTDPDVYARRILLSRSADLGGTYQSRTFRVLSVADDCEPFPLPAGSTGTPTQFVWSVLDNTQAAPTWTYQTNTTESFTISQSMFPNARPGDTVELRVEVRDTLVQQLYRSGGQVCDKDTVDICCGSIGCGTSNDCVRWTTWTVQFQP